MKEGIGRYEEVPARRFVGDNFFYFFLPSFHLLDFHLFAFLLLAFLININLEIFLELYSKERSFREGNKEGKGMEEEGK